MRRPTLVLALVLAAVLGWTGSLLLDHPTQAPPRALAPGLDGPATARWAVRAPAAATPRRSDLSNDGLAGLERAIAAREYEATANAEGLQAPNRAHGFRTYFEPGGVRVVERSATSRDLVGLHLARVGRNERLVDVSPGAVTAHGARVEIRRSAELVEWYENSPRGLEQGFTLASRPAGDGPVVLDLAVAGARAHATGDGATFATAAGPALSYSALTAVDARGHALGAHLVAEDARIRISVDDAGATYPVTIDPLLGASADGLIFVVQTNSNYGLALANGGDVNGDGYEDLLVGAYTYDSGQADEGAVFLYLGSPNGITTGSAPSATFQSDQAQGWMGYGLAAADVNGDGYSDVLAGGYDMSDGQAGEGIVCVFMGGPSIANGTPANAAALLEVNSVTAAFGQSVANAGDVNGDGYEDVLVGAPEYNSIGAAFVFLGGAGGVSTAPATTLLGVVANDTDFGGAVAGAGDINADGYDDICVTDPQYHNGQTNEGGLFTWLGSATGIPNGSASAAPSILQTNQVNVYLGYKGLAAAGDVNGDGYADVIVGCLGWTDGEAGEGAAFLLRGTAAGFPTGSVATAAMTILEMNLAGAGVQRVAGGGDVNGDGYADVVVGSPSYDYNGVTNTGAAAVYLGGPGGVTSVTPSLAHAFLHPGAASDAFGVGLAMGDWNGDGFADVAVGANGYDGLATNQGAVYLYSGGSRGIASTSDTGAATIRQGEQAGARFGVVATAGDVNGDGYSDLIVGAPYYDAGETDEGAAFVYLGGVNGIASGAATSGAALLQGNQAGASFGYAVSTAGDVNDDGFADVLVGAPSYDAGQTDEGAAFVFPGGVSGVANGDPATAAATLQSNQAGAHFGYAVAGGFDVNGDGHVDVAVGAPEYSSAGGVFVFHGGATGIANGDPSTAARALVESQASGRFGASIGVAGDVNGDGYGDLIVGQPSCAALFPEGGAAAVYDGSASGIGPVAQTRIDAQEANANLGSSVAGAGDVNGDGYDDVIVGAWRAGSTDAGAAWVFHGSATGVPSANPGAANAAFSGAGANAYMGAAVAGIGDVDGDGYADVAIGSWNASSQGTVLVYRGGAAGVGSNGSILVTGQNGASLGDAVAGAGDVNGDGFADLAAGASTWDSGQTDEGGAFVLKGGGGLPVRPSLAEQRRGDGSGLAVQPWGDAHSSNGTFHAGMTAVDPAGRGREKVEIETCPAGKPFGAPECTRTTSPTWTDAGFGIGNPGVPLSTSVTLASGGFDHWRVRTLHARLSVTQPGIAARPAPAHGPWRRAQARANAGDLRIAAVVLAVDRPGTSADFAIAPLGNPARGRIALAATLPNSESAEVALFDVAGRQVASHVIGGSPGRQTLTLARAGEIAPGVYLVRLTQGGRAATTRVVFVK